MGFKNLSGCDPSNGSNIAKRFGLNVKREFFKIKRIIGPKKDNLNQY